MKMSDLDRRRTENFLRILRERYQDSPTEFEIATGYGKNMVSQIKTGKKFVGDRRARKLEELMKLSPLTLDEPPGSEQRPLAPQPRPKWPLSVPLEQFAALSPKLQREIDEAFTRMVLGAQAQDLLNRQAKKKTGQ